GSEVYQYTLRAGNLECEILNYGGILRAFKVPDKDNNKIDILLGFDNIAGYKGQGGYLGALIGRNANRIKEGKFTLLGKEYSLAINRAPNHLHGGDIGFDQKIWEVKESGENFLKLHLESSDMDEGYPGNMKLEVVYTLDEKGLEIDYTATCDKTTLCNLTNHAYFNLNGHNSGTIHDQKLWLFADFYTPTDETSIPYGENEKVENTPMDFREGMKIGDHIDDDFQQLNFAKGYDHNFVINGEMGVFRPAAVAYSEKTGIKMTVETTQPGIQFYSGNYLDDCPLGKDGAPYDARWGFCLETQHFPDAINNENFPSTILNPGEIYRHTTKYSFEIE
ncbi:MAG: galactose mutarotase, partial [Clostridia bacterium]|nr:galactose mutarotase [Clostridia bacterium]